MSDCISEPDNPSLVYCPRCRSPLQRIGRFLVCPAHGVVESQAAVMARQTPLRLFLSYGHDANEELVSRIRSDLEQRGHDVWFDRNEIRPGDDWRRAITDGIISSDKFISFLSKHSTRDPGVCRDEIAIAIGVKGGNIQTILVESEHEVQPPVSIGHIQWLDMHDWKEWRDVGGAEWEEWYQSRFAEIVRVVECDESRRFSGEIEALSSDLKPVKSDTRIAALLSRGFCGRHWLSRALEDWRTQQPRGSRLFWITGAPGVGKSAFAAQLAHSGSDMVVAAHFCDWAMADHRDARRVIRSLAFQLATRIPDYRRLLLTLPEIAELDGKDAATLFDYLLATPLRSVIHGHRERYLIVIDAVDEAGDGGRNALVEILSRYAPSLPDWIGVVVTSRPEFDVVCALQSLQPYSLDARSESNREDLREYLWAQLAEPLQHVPDADRLVERILENCEGVFLYVERFCEDVQCGHLSLNAPELFPQGLGGIYVQYFQRMFPDPEHFRRVVRPALRMILAAREPLPLDMLQRQFEWTIEELHDFLRLVASLFPRQRLSGQDVIKPAHRSIADWLSVESRSGPWFVSVAEGHRQLADVCWRQFEQSEQGVEEMTPYALSHLVAHLISDARWDSIASVLRHLPYCEERVRAGQSFALADDFRDAISAWPEDRAERRPLELLHEALCRDLHFIAGHAADYPQALFQSVWNSAWWYDSAAAADHYQTAADDMDAAPAGKGMPISGRLSELLEQWRGEGRGGRRGPWLRALRPPHLQLGSGQLVSLRGHRGAVNSVAYSSDGRRLLTASADGTARLWDARNGQELRVLSGHAGEVNVAGFSCDGFRIVTGSDDGSVRLWDSDTGRETAVLRGHRNWIRGAAFLEQDRTVVSCSDDHTVRLWDRESGRETAVLQGHEGIVYAVAAAPDNRLLVSGSYDQTLRLWDVASASELAVLGGHEDTVRCVAFSPNGRWIASGSDDRTVRLWNVVTGRVTQILRGHDRNVRSVAFSPDGQRIVSGSYDNTARVWDTESGQLMAVLQGHDDWVKGVTFSPDGRQVATASRDQTAQTWKSAGGRIPAVLHGHQGCILDVAFSPNGRRVISRDEYGELLAWDAVSGRVLRPTPADSVALVQRRSSSLTGRVSLENGETVISLTAGMPAVVRFPAALQDLQVHPEGSRWAGGVGSHLVLLQLENAPAGSEGQSTG